MIYELITPSDPITFEAENDKIAYITAIILSNGKAGVNREDGESIPCMFLFCPDPEPVMKEYLGQDPGDFIEQNRKAIGDCFLSFAYGSFSSRREFNDAITAITDPDKLEAFKKEHEDRNRTSMSAWVNSAWRIGKKMQKPKELKTS